MNIEQLALKAYPIILKDGYVGAPRPYDINEIKRNAFTEGANTILETFRNVSRFEVINYKVDNGWKVGRVITLYKERNGFKNIDFELQDEDKTLKIFIK